MCYVFLTCSEWRPRRGICSFVCFTPLACLLALRRRRSRDWGWDWLAAVYVVCRRPDIFVSVSEALLMRRRSFCSVMVCVHVLLCARLA